MTTIGFDLDGVLADFMSAVKGEFGEPDNPSAYSLFSQFPKLDGDEYNKFVTNPAMYRGLPVIPGALSSVKYIASYATICYVTARPNASGMLKATIDWLYKRGNFPYGPVLIVSWEDKPKAVAQLLLDAYIEDSPEHVKNMRDLGVNAIVYDQPWNQGIAGPRIWWKEVNINDAFDIIRGVAGTD